MREKMTIASPGFSRRRTLEKKLLCPLARLDSIFVNSDEADIETVARQTWATITSRSELAELIIGACERGLRSAYFHSNGFLKIELTRSARSQMRLRAHFWNTDWSINRLQNPHDHAFTYCSRILLGQLRHRIFVEDNNGGLNYHRYRYSRDMRAGQDEYKLEAAGTAMLRISSESTFSEGTVYRLGSTEIHAVDPWLCNRAITLMISCPVKHTADSYVYSESGQLHLNKRNSRQLSHYEIVQALNEFGLTSHGN